MEGMQAVLKSVDLVIFCRRRVEMMKLTFRLFFHSFSLLSEEGDRLRRNQSCSEICTSSCLVTSTCTDEEEPDVQILLFVSSSPFTPNLRKESKMLNSLWPEVCLYFVCVYTRRSVACVGFIITFLILVTGGLGLNDWNV